MIWVVAYDIPDDKRRRKVQKILEGFGRSVQYSVFECDLNPDKLARLERRLRLVIADGEDNIRLYPLNKADLKRVRLLGCATLELPNKHRII